VKFPHVIRVFNSLKDSLDPDKVLKTSESEVKRDLTIKGHAVTRIWMM